MSLQTDEPCHPDYDMARLWPCWQVHRQWLIASLLGAAYADPKLRAQLKPEAVWEVENGLHLSAATVYRASVDRSAWYLALLKLFERYDYLLLPTTQIFPFDAREHWPQQIAGHPMDTYHRWMEIVIGPTLAGLPAISVPVGFNRDGLPLGMQLIGPPQADMAVLQLAYAHEQHTRWVQKRPPPILQSF